MISQELAALTQQTYVAMDQLIALSNEVNRAFHHSEEKAKLSQSLVVTGEKKVNELAAGKK